MKKPFALMFLGAIMLLAGCTAGPGGDQGGGTTNPQESTDLLTSLGLSIYSDYVVGESAIFYDDLKITVNSVKITRFYTYYSNNWDITIGKIAASGKKYIIFDTEVKNVGESSLNLKEEYFTLVDNNGNYYDPVDYGEQESLSFGTIGGGLRRVGKILFEVPKAVTNSVLLFDLRELFTDNQKAAFVYDSDATVIPETLSGTIEITSVDYTTSSIKYIYYDIDNTGNVGFVPIIDYTISDGTKPTLPVLSMS
jgi:hypothetical protein